MHLAAIWHRVMSKSVRARNAGELFGVELERGMLDRCIIACVLGGLLFGTTEASGLDSLIARGIASLLGVEMSLATAAEVVSAHAETAAAEIKPPAFSRIVIDPAGASRLEGTGTPGSQVIVKSSERVIGAAIVEATGQWKVMLLPGLAAGEHYIATAAAAGDGIAMPLYGEEVRIAVPERFAGATLLTFEPTDGLAPWKATRSRAEDLANAASQEFSKVMAVNGEAGNIADAGDTNSVGATQLSVEPKPHEAQPHVVMGPTLWDHAREWLTRANREYQNRIARPLSRPPPGSGQPADQTVDTAAASRPLDPPAITAPSEAELAARAYAEERRLAEESWARKHDEAADTTNADARRTNDDGASGEAAAKRRAEDLQLREAAAKARIAEALKALEDAKRRAAERRAAEVRKANDEAARKIADNNASKKAETKQLFAEQQKAARDEAETAKRSASEPPPQSLSEAVEREEEEDLRHKTGSEDVIELPAEEGSAEPAGDDKDEAVRPRRHGAKARAAASKSRRSAATSCPARGYVKRNGKRQLYVVGRHDTLWAIAHRQYGRGERYNMIYLANRRRIADPDVIRPCQMIVLPRKRR